MKLKLHGIIEMGSYTVSLENLKERKPTLAK